MKNYLHTGNCCSGYNLTPGTYYIHVSNRPGGNTFYKLNFVPETTLTDTVAESRMRELVDLAFVGNDRAAPTGPFAVGKSPLRKSPAPSVVASVANNMQAMSAVNLPDQRQANSRERAARSRVASQQLARIGVSRFFSAPDERFQRAVDYVLGENAELYMRLG